MNEDKIKELVQSELESLLNRDIDKSAVTDERVREIIREELPALLAKSVTTIEGDLNLSDGRNLIVGGTTGSKFGTSTSQKFGFWNKSPIIQPTSADQAALALDVDVTGGDTVDKTAINTNFTSIQTLVNQLRSDLVSAGIIKGSA